MRCHGALLVLALSWNCWSIFGQEQATDQPTEQAGGAQTSGAAQTPDARDPIFYPGDTERVKPLARKLLRNTLLDQKEIWTSPFHMHGKDAELWIGFGAATAALIASDRHTSGVFENSPGQVGWGNHISNIGASYTLLPLVAGLYGYGVLRDDPKPREAGVLGGEALLDSLVVAEALKQVARRNRPDSLSQPGQFFDGGDSFPSGHAIESWALASVIAHEYQHSPWVQVSAYGLASVVGAARFAAQRHYASDIFAGAAMGWFIGRYVYQTHLDHSIHKHAAFVPRVIPQLEPSQRSYGVALRFGN